MPTSKPRKMLSPSLVWATQDVSVTHQGKANAKTKSGPRQQGRKVTDTQGLATSLMCLWNFLRLLLRTSLWLSSKDSACNARDVGSIFVLGRSSGEGNGNSLQYSCLENPHGQRSLAGSSPWDLKESSQIFLALVEIKLVKYRDQPIFLCLS